MGSIVFGVIIGICAILFIGDLIAGLILGILGMIIHAAIT